MTVYHRLFTNNVRILGCLFRWSFGIHRHASEVGNILQVTARGVGNTD